MFYIPVECDEETCPLYSRRSCVPTAISRKTVDEVTVENDTEGSVGLAVIGGIPTKAEAASKVPFIDEPNTLMKKFLNMGGVPQGGHALIPVIRCSLPTDIEDRGEFERIKESALTHCKKYLDRDVERVNPKAVLLCGPDAVKSVTGEPVIKQVPGIKSPVGRYGHVEKHQIGNKKYTTINTLSPDAVYKQVSSFSYAVSCVDKAKDLVINGTKSMYHPMRWKTNPEIHYCDTVEKIKTLVDYLLHKTNAKQVCAFDVETMNLNAVYGNKLVMLQFCVDPHEVWCVPYQYMFSQFSADDLEDIKKELYKLFTEKPNFKAWVGHGVVFDMLQIMEHITNGKTITNRPVFDTQVMIYCLDENRIELSNAYGLNLKLKTLSKECIGRDAYAEDILLEREAGALYKLPPDKLIDYAGNDVVNTHLLYQYARLVAKGQGYLEKMIRLCTYLFSSAIRLTAVLKRNGMFIPLPYIRNLTSKSSPIFKRMAEIDELFKNSSAAKKANKVLAKSKQKNQKMIFGTPWIFDINKTDHRGELYFNQLKLKPLKYGADIGGEQGKPSTDDDFWERYKDTCDEASWAQEYFGLKKLASSYAQSILEYVDPQYGNIDCSTDSRVRPTFTLTKTTTGRTASFAPNGQNFPKADNEAKAAIKSMVQAQQDDGNAYEKDSNALVTKVLLQNDFVTAEIRVWSNMARDMLLSSAINYGMKLREEYRKNPTPELKKKAKVEGDQHRRTAANMFNKKPEDVTDDERQAAKRIVFGLMYGRGIKAIAEQLKNPNLEEVSDQCAKFSGAYPEGVGWFYRMEDHAVKHLYVESELFRRRRLYAPIAYDSSLPKDHPHKGAFAEAKRQARNSPIQVQSSDFGLIGSFLFLNYIEKHNKSWKIINIVHDSCVAEVPLNELREASDVMDKCFTKDLMEYVKENWGVDFICPLEVECEFGIRWGEMEKWDSSDPDFDRLYKWLESGGVKKFEKH